MGRNYWMYILCIVSHSIHLSAISIPHSSLTSSPEAGIILTASGISIKANADWSYKLSFVWVFCAHKHSILLKEKDIFACMIIYHMYEYTRRDHGTVDLSGSDISLRVGVVVGVDRQNHPTLSSTDCSFNVNNLKVKFHGGARSVTTFTTLYTHQILSYYNIYLLPFCTYTPPPMYIM